MFQGRLRCVPRDLEGCFKRGSSVSKRSSKGVSGKFQRLWKFLGCLKNVFSVFQTKLHGWVKKEVWSKKNLSTKIKVPTKIGLITLFKIGSVTAETLLICTNFARTYVTWTNVIITVGIC